MAEEITKLEGLKSVYRRKKKKRKKKKKFTPSFNGFWTKSTCLIFSNILTFELDR